MFHPMTNSMWVDCFITLPGSLIDHVSSHDEQYVSDTAYYFARPPHQSLCLSHGQQGVSDTALFHYQAALSIMFDQQPVSDAALFLCQAASSIMFPTGSECHCFISLPGSIINHVSSLDQQEVSVTALFLCQAVSSIMFHPMTNSLWVTLLYFISKPAQKLMLSYELISDC